MANDPLQAAGAGGRSAFAFAPCRR